MLTIALSQVLLQVTEAPVRPRNPAFSRALARPHLPRSEWPIGAIPRFWTNPYIDFRAALGGGLFNGRPETHTSLGRFVFLPEVPDSPCALEAGAIPD